MSCCHHNHVDTSKPQKGNLSNLAYLELLSKIEEHQKHAEAHHKKEQWKCKYLFHDWHEIIDDDYDKHAVCHRCGKYKPNNTYRSPTYYHGY